MGYTREDYLARLETVLQDSAEELQPDDKFRLLSQAAVLFSKDKPLTKIKEETGDGTSYDFELPSDWVDGISYIVGEIEYPADSTAHPSQSPQYLESVDWKFFKKLVSTVTTTYLRMLTFIPASGYTLRYEYALMHTLNETMNTINDADIEAVVSLAAALCFWALAAKFSQSTSPSIEADVIDYQRKSDMYKDLAIAKQNDYRAIMGIGKDAEGSAGAGNVTKDMDMSFAWSEDMLTHPARWR
jgi:hypothetical protein